MTCDMGRDQRNVNVMKCNVSCTRNIIWTTFQHISTKCMMCMTSMTSTARMWARSRAPYRVPVRSGVWGGGGLGLPWYPGPQVSRTVQYHVSRITLNQNRKNVRTRGAAVPGTTSLDGEMPVTRHKDFPFDRSVSSTICLNSRVTWLLLSSCCCACSKIRARFSSDVYTWFSLRIRIAFIFACRLPLMT